MTIGEYIKQNQPHIYRLLTLMTYPPVRKIDAGEDIDRLMREKPGFWRDEKLPR